MPRQVASDVGPAKAPKLLDRLRTAIRLRHFSRKTEEAYVGWARRFILFHGKRHPSELGETEVTAFLTHLAWAKRSAHVPVALTRDEVVCVLDRLSGTPWLVVALLYGAGLRLTECLELRVKDLDVGGRQILVRSGRTHWR